MKKLMTAVITAAAIASIGAVTSLAAVPADRPYYTDANGDGVCDNYGSYSHHGYSYTDSDGDGICDNYGSRQYGGHGCGSRMGHCR